MEKQLTSDEEIIEALKRIKGVNDIGCKHAEFGIIFNLDDGTSLFIGPMLVDIEDGVVKLEFAILGEEEE